MAGDRPRHPLRLPARRAGRPWLVRWYQGDGAYRQETIRYSRRRPICRWSSDTEFCPSDAVSPRPCRVATCRVRRRVSGATLTVRMSIETYLAERDDRERRAQRTAFAWGEAGDEAGQDVYLRRDARSRLTKHVLSNVALCDIPLSKLAEGDLTAWRERLSPMAATSVRRLTNDFKAALNRAAQKNRPRLPDTVAGVIRNGLAMPEATGNTARPDQVLPDADVRLILVAARDLDAEDGWEATSIGLLLFLQQRARDSVRSSV